MNKLQKFYTSNVRKIAEKGEIDICSMNKETQKELYEYLDVINSAMEN